MIGCFVGSAVELLVILSNIAGLFMGIVIGPFVGCLAESFVWAVVNSAVGFRVELTHEERFEVCSIVGAIHKSDMTDSFAHLVLAEL